MSKYNKITTYTPLQQVSIYVGDLTQDITEVKFKIYQL